MYLIKKLLCMVFVMVFIKCKNLYIDNGCEIPYGDSGCFRVGVEAACGGGCVCLDSDETLFCLSGF
jgi:hypothetical protein